MTDKQIQKIIEIGTEQGFIKLQFMEAVFAPNDLVKVRTTLRGKNLFTPKDSNPNIMYPTSLAYEVIEKYKNWSNYVKEREIQESLELEKAKVDLQLAKETLKEFPRTKLFARIGFIIAVLLALKELYILLKPLLNQ